VWNLLEIHSRDKDLNKIRIIHFYFVVAGVVVWEQLFRNLKMEGKANNTQTMEQLSNHVTELSEELQDEMKILREGLSDEAGLLSKESLNLSRLEELSVAIAENVESMKGEILEEINLNVKENYRLSVLDDKVNSLRSEVDSIRSDILQFRNEFQDQTAHLCQLIKDLTDNVNNKNNQD
jgi:gas vesicle protein